MDKEEIITLSNYRLEQAKENLEEATVLFENNKYKGASNRAYYLIFHAVKAVLAIEQTDFKKHSSVIAYFNKEYISKDIFPKELGKRVSEARFYRKKSDYVDFYIITKEECNLHYKMLLEYVNN
ncbi:MAG TPA: HEPN domain-containing protein [Clostridiales bacterium]|nr:HEPN domain-containing protein [Clostridiales bacterium]